MAVVALLALALAGCSTSATTPYFPADTTRVTHLTPISTGGTAATGFTRLKAQPGDRVELVAAEPLDMEGDAPIKAYVLLMSATGGGGVGAGDVTGEMLPGQVVSDLLVPLEGFVLTPDIGQIQVVFATTPGAPGRISWDRSRLRYRVNGHSRWQDWDYGTVVCAGDPPPECSFEDPSPAPA